MDLFQSIPLIWQAQIVISVALYILIIVPFFYWLDRRHVVRIEKKREEEHAKIEKKLRKSVEKALLRHYRDLEEMNEKIRSSEAEPAEERNGSADLKQSTLRHYRRRRLEIREEILELETELGIISFAEPRKELETIRLKIDALRTRERVLERELGARVEPAHHHRYD